MNENTEPNAFDDAPSMPISTVKRHGTSKRHKCQPALTNLAATGTEWEGGSTQHLTWMTEGAVAEVTLDLRGIWNEEWDDNNMSVANTGAHNVTVPHGLTPGEYELHICSTADDSVEASCTVTIDRNSTPPAITNLTVTALEWEGGSTQHLTWTTEGAVAKVDLDIRRVSGHGYDSVTDFSGDWMDNIGVANTGAHDVIVPHGLTPGKYELHISSDADPFVEASCTITIDRGKMPPALRNLMIQYPICHTGSRQHLTWTTEGTVSDINLYILRVSTNGYAPSVMSFNDVGGFNIDVANTGAYDISIPLGLMPGEYLVRINSVADDTIVADVGLVIDDARRSRCVKVGVLLLGLPAALHLPYILVRRIAILSV